MQALPMRIADDDTPGGPGCRDQVPSGKAAGAGPRPFELAHDAACATWPEVWPLPALRPTDDFLTQRGAPSVGPSDDTLLYQHPDAGNPRFSATMARPAQLLILPSADACRQPRLESIRLPTIEGPPALPNQCPAPMRAEPKLAPGPQNAGHWEASSCRLDGQGLESERIPVTRLNVQELNARRSGSHYLNTQRCDDAVSLPTEL